MSSKFRKSLTLVGISLRTLPDISRNFSFPGHEPDRITGKIIQSPISEFWGTKQADIGKTHPNMDEFSRNRSSSCSDIFQKLNRYSQKIYGLIFQKSVQLMPRKLKFRKNTGRVFQKSVCVTPRKTEISEKNSG